MLNSNKTILNQKTSTQMMFLKDQFQGIVKVLNICVSNKLSGSIKKIVRDIRIKGNKLGIVDLNILPDFIPNVVESN